MDAPDAALLHKHSLDLYQLVGAMLEKIDDVGALKSHDPTVVELHAVMAAIRGDAED